MLQFTFFSFHLPHLRLVLQDGDKHVILLPFVRIALTFVLLYPLPTHFTCRCLRMVFKDVHELVDLYLIRIGLADILLYLTLTDSTCPCLRMTFADVDELVDLHLLVRIVLCRLDNEVAAKVKVD